jgi:hypothetical protein
VIGLTLDSRVPRGEEAQPLISDVEGRIEVAIMKHAAVRTDPHTLGEREVLVLETAFALFGTLTRYSGPGARRVLGRRTAPCNSSVQRLLRGVRTHSVGWAGRDTSGSGRRPFLLLSNGLVLGL